jgi:DNA polymerase III delta subunit
MASMELKATNFLSQKDPNHINFFLYGEEPSLAFRCLKHVLLNEDMKMIEKIYLNLDDENFESNFTQSIMTNSLFNEKKIIFINLEKNRLNKDILKNISIVCELESSNKIIMQAPNISKKVFKKDIAPTLTDKFVTIDCSILYESDVVGFLEQNLPESLNNRKSIMELVSLYEGNFSLLVNDIDLIQLLPDDSDLRQHVFGDSSVKNNFKLAEYIANNNYEAALEIVDSMERNDRNSITLLIWMLTRDCNALNALKMGRKNLKEFGIWDSQINLYQKMENRLTKNQITEVTSILDDADKKVKGVLPGNSWLTAREAVRLLSA